VGGMTIAHDVGARPRVLIIVQNLPVPFDRRVWLESKALTAAGYDVTVVCPNTTSLSCARRARATPVTRFSRASRF